MTRFVRFFSAHGHRIVVCFNSIRMSQSAGYRAFDFRLLVNQLIVEGTWIGFLGPVDQWLCAAKPRLHGIGGTELR